MRKPYIENASALSDCKCNIPNILSFQFNEVVMEYLDHYRVASHSIICKTILIITCTIIIA